MFPPRCLLAGGVVDGTSSAYASETQRYSLSMHFGGNPVNSTTCSKTCRSGGRRRSTTYWRTVSKDGFGPKLVSLEAL